MRNRNYRYNPLSDNISDVEINSYLQQKLPALMDKVQSAEPVKQTFFQMFGVSSVSELQDYFGNLLPSVIKVQIDNLEKKIQELALEMAVKEAKDQYGVDISEQLYEKFGVARSNPRRTGRGRRYRNSKSPLGSIDLGFSQKKTQIILNKSERDFLNLEGFPAKFTEQRIFGRNLIPMLNSLEMAKKENRQYIMPQEWSYDRKERMFNQLIDKIKSQLRESGLSPVEDIQFDYGRIINSSDSGKIYGGRGRFDAKALNRPRYMDLNLAQIRNHAIGLIKDDRNVINALNEMLSKIESDYDPQRFNEDNAYYGSEVWVDKDGYPRVRVTFASEPLNGTDVDALFVFTPSLNLISVSIIIDTENII